MHTVRPELVEGSLSCFDTLSTNGFTNTRELHTSIWDYAASFLGYIGLATPNFLLALIILWLAYSYFGVNLGGLFSLHYENASWSVGKVLDLLKHIWVPVVVVGTSGTAALIRILRANLLDELNKPYVEAVCFDARFLCGDLREDNCIQCYSFL